MEEALLAMLSDIFSHDTTNGCCIVAVIILVGVTHVVLKPGWIGGWIRGSPEVEVCVRIPIGLARSLK